MEWADEIISSDRARVEIWRRWFRNNARNDLYFLAFEILGYTDMDPWFHGEMCRRRNDWPYREDGTPYDIVADFEPRGGFKTCILGVAKNIQDYLRCPEETILIEHGVSAQAEDILGEIKTHFEENEIIRWAFPDLTWESPKGQAKKWTKEKLTLPRRGNYKEATFNIASAEMTKVGGHYTKIVFDDLVCEDNVTSDDMMSKVYQHFKKQLLLHDERHIRQGDAKHWPWMPKYTHLFFRIQIIATRWDLRDCNSRVIDPEGEFRGLVDFHIQKALTPPRDKEHEEWDLERLMEDGKSFFPSRFPREKLKRLCQKLGTALFSAQMQQDPYPPEAALFRAKDFVPFDAEGVSRKNMWYFTAVDPNNKSEDYKADFGVVITAGVDAIGNIYVMKIDREHFTPKAQIDALMNHIRIFRPRRVAIETVGYQRSLQCWVKEYMKSSPELRVPIVPMKRGGSSQHAKHQRILKLQPYVESHRIHVNDPRFIQEAAYYPRTKKDQLDALVDAIRISSRPPFNHHQQVASDKLKAINDAKSNGDGGSHDILGLLGVKEGPRRRRGKRSRRFLNPSEQMRALRWRDRRF